MNINATSSFSNIQQINKDYSAEQPVEVKQDNSSPQATGDKVSLGGADKEVGVHKNGLFFTMEQEIIILLTVYLLM